MTFTVIALVLLLVAIVFGGGRSKRRKHLDDLGLGESAPTSGEQMYDANSFEHTKHGE